MKIHENYHRRTTDEDIEKGGSNAIDREKSTFTCEPENWKEWFSFIVAFHLDEEWGRKLPKRIFGWRSWAYWRVGPKFKGNRMVLTQANQDPRYQIIPLAIINRLFR